MRNSIFYLASLSGHRREYQDIISGACGLTPYVASPGLKVFLTLLRSERLLFGTLDDSYGLFFAVALFRSLVGKRTVGVFLRPQMCFLKGIRYRAKKAAFVALKHFKRVSVYTIVPFSVCPQYSQVATDGLLDPHIWDKVGEIKDGEATSLAREISTASNGKTVISFIGSVSRIKGIRFLSEVICQGGNNDNNFFTVIAGKFSDDNLDLLTSLEPRGDVAVFQRYISDAEMFELYKSSDMIWSCYHPSYDQASGVFGRSVQYGNVPILRKKSVIDKISRDLGVKSVAIDYGDVVGAVRTLNELAPKRDPKSGDLKERLIYSRSIFINTIRNAL